MSFLLKNKQQEQILLKHEHVPTFKNNLLIFFSDIMNLSLVWLSVVDYLTCWLFICAKNKQLGGVRFEHAQEHRTCPYNTDINCQWNRALGAKGGGTLTSQNHAGMDAGKFNLEFRK